MLTIDDEIMALGLARDGFAVLVEFRRARRKLPGDTPILALEEGDDEDWDSAEEEEEEDAVAE